MNIILQQRIEEAAKKICCTGCPMGIIRDCKRCVAMENAIETGIFALQNQWISVEEALPDRRRNVLILLDDGDVRVGYHGDMWYWCDGFVSSKNPNGDCNYTSSVSIKGVTNWMPIPSIETVTNCNKLKGGEE